MSHVLFALFDSSKEVAAAISELESVGTPTRHCTVVAHRDGLESRPAGELELFETGAASMGARLAGLGAVVGAALGALAVGPLGLLAGGPLAAMLFATTTGSVVGGFTGIIAGASEADPSLKQVAEGLEKGHVLLAVEPPSAECAEKAEIVLRKHHAQLVHRHLLRGLTMEEKRDLGRA